MSLAFGIVGALGRMGQAIARASLSDSRLRLVKAFEAAEHPQQGGDFQALTGLRLLSMVKLSTLHKDELTGLAGVIDFSQPESSVQTAGLCAEAKVPLVIGTTGFTKEQQAAIQRAADSIAIVQSSNMSVGVNLLFALTRQAARVLRDKHFDPEITEIHHRLKKDAPSGTAKTLEKILLQEYGWDETQARFGRAGMVGERPKEELGIFALRGGDVVGEHTVFFLGDGERLELKHQATSRDTFAQGALAALLFLQGKPAGLYAMADVLGLN